LSEVYIYMVRETKSRSGMIKVTMKWGGTAGMALGGGGVLMLSIEPKQNKMASSIVKMHGNNKKNGQKTIKECYIELSKLL
jgi:hypothetical protein